MIRRRYIEGRSNLEIPNTIVRDQFSKTHGFDLLKVIDGVISHLDQSHYPFDGDKTEYSKRGNFAEAELNQRVGKVNVNSSTR